MHADMGQRMSSILQQLNKVRLRTPGGSDHQDKENAAGAGSDPFMLHSLRQLSAPPGERATCVRVRPRRRACAALTWQPGHTRRWY